MIQNPTFELTAAVAAFSAGRSLRVGAYAGAGKTATLALMAEATNRRGIYRAFNKAIAQEAKGKFPDTVKCSTLHALAFGAMVRTFPPASIAANINGGLLVEPLKLRPGATPPA